MLVAGVRFWIYFENRNIEYTDGLNEGFQRGRKLKACSYFLDFPGGSDGKASVYNAGDPGSIPGSGRFPGEGNGNPLQYYYLENPMDRGAWQATVHGVTKSWT